MVSRILDIGAPKLEQQNTADKSVALNIKIGRAKYMEKYGVASELEYKQQCIQEKRINFHAHIGLNSWSATETALQQLYDAGRTHGFCVDRAGICLDRRMGLPENLRQDAIAETGPMLSTAEEWQAVAKATPIIPHMGDFMIGFPASLENTIQALTAGVTTIGNLSQFFSHEAPGWKNTGMTTLRTVEAIALMGRLSDRGTMVHSYLEDGFGALFYDCATIAGWAFLEKYIVETLLGARLSHCIGGLTSDPVKRAGWVFALDDIHDHDCIGTMFYGDTISFTRNLAENSGLVSEYLLWDILAQMACPTGHAVLPLPLTEGVRIPSVDEIIEAQILGRRIQKTAQRIFPYFDFTDARRFAAKIVTGGKQVFRNALDGFAQAGIDTRDPVELLFVLKKLGPSVFEEMFGAGPVDDDFIRKHKPIVKTDIFKLSEKSVKEHKALFQSPGSKSVLSGLNLMIASTDVHEHAIMMLAQLCREAGADVMYLGAEKNPDDIAAAASENRVDGILLSTHNGMALAFARELKSIMDKQHIKIPVIMGGVLNQKMDNCDLPVEVSSDLKALGFLPYARLEDNLTNLITNAAEAASSK